VGAQAVVLAYGTVVHVARLVAGGLTPYWWAPAWLAAYFTVLTVAILVTDAAANGYAAACAPGSGRDANNEAVPWTRSGR
jgi:hypothetical protein